MIGELQIAYPDFRPGVLVEGRAAGDDEVGPEAVDAQLFARALVVVRQARLRQHHERVRIVVRYLWYRLHSKN